MFTLRWCWSLRYTIQTLFIFLSLWLYWKQHLFSSNQSSVGWKKAREMPLSSVSNLQVSNRVCDYRRWNDESLCTQCVVKLRGVANISSWGRPPFRQHDLYQGCARSLPIDHQVSISQLVEHPSVDAVWVVFCVPLYLVIRSNEPLQPRQGESNDRWVDVRGISLPNDKRTHFNPPFINITSIALSAFPPTLSIDEPQQLNNSPPTPIHDQNAVRIPTPRRTQVAQTPASRKPRDSPLRALLSVVTRSWASQ